VIHELPFWPAPLQALALVVNPRLKSQHNLLLFVDDYHLDIEVNLDQEAFYFHLGMFTTSFI
jgi:hypothetical protein